MQKVEVAFTEGDNNFLTHSMVDKMLIQNGDFVKNQAKSVVDLHFLETNVLASPYVEKANVFLTIDGVLKSVVKQRTAIARLVEKGETKYIDKYGVVMPLSAKSSARVPLVFGVGEDKTAINELIHLIEFIQGDDFLIKEIIAIHKTALNEYKFTVRSGSHKVVFGDLSDMPMKFKRLKAFYNKALADKSIKKYKTINVKYRNQVVCTKYNQDGKQ